MSTVSSSTGIPAVATVGLGKRYGSLWALADCSITIPEGSVTALIGPNGAGKTTLLRLLVGLSVATEGSASVLGRRPTEEFLASIGYLAQDVLLYRRLTADDHLEIGARLNRTWDASSARTRLAALHVPMDRPIATLSGGQSAQVDLGLALAKRRAETRRLIPARLTRRPRTVMCPRTSILQRRSSVFCDPARGRVTVRNGENAN